MAAAGWYHGAALAVLPWLVVWRPHWGPLLVVTVVASWGAAARGRQAELWPSALAAVSSATFLVVYGGWSVAGGWLALGVLAAALAWLLASPRWGRPDAADAAAMVGWAVALAVRPQLLAVDGGGWLAPLVWLVAARRLAASLPSVRMASGDDPLPPSREARGTVSLRGVVAAGADSLPRTVPIELELRAGTSMAVLCDDPGERDLLAGLLAGRQPPASGELAVDGVPVGPDDRLVAVVAPGERFLAGGLEVNLGALCHHRPDRAALAAVAEACGLAEVRAALGESVLGVDGSPLEPLHRMLIQAGRVIPSHYRVVVVVDPMPWVNPVRGERWRSAVVRASVGRTAVWITADRDLAQRASEVLEFRQGSLRPVGGGSPGLVSGGPG